MLLKILLLNLVLCLTDAGAYAKPGSNDLVEKLELRLRDMETRMQDEKEKQAKEKKELKEAMIKLEDRMKEEKEELGNRVRELEASKLRVEDSSRPDSTYNNSLTNPSPRDLPIVIISAWQSNALTSPQTVTFESFLANFNNAARPGGGDGVLDLDSGVFTCFTPGYYTVSISAYADVSPTHKYQQLHLYKNGEKIPESFCHLGIYEGAINDGIGVSVSRILVGTLFDMFS